MERYKPSRKIDNSYELIINTFFYINTNIKYTSLYFILI